MSPKLGRLGFLFVAIFLAVGSTPQAASDLKHKEIETMNLKPGIQAPEFSLSANDGKEYSLKQFLGKKVVLYFYPKDDTPGCTKEACSFRDQSSQLQKKGAVVLGVSADTVDSHKKFVSKYELNFPLLSDPQKNMLKSYGVLKEGGGIARTTFLIDSKGTIAQIFENVKVDGHSDEILKALEKTP